MRQFPFFLGNLSFSFPGNGNEKKTGIPGARKMGAREWIPYFLPILVLNFVVIQIVKVLLIIDSMFVKDTFVKIARSEGITALWSGLPPTL